MKTRATVAALAALPFLLLSGLAAEATDFRRDFSTEVHAVQQVQEGRNTFRYATFGDEAFWGDGIGLHLAIAGAAHGGVGPGVSPKAALGVGLKVDVNALPRSLQRALARGKVDLDDPATTLELLKLDAVLGITGIFDSSGKLASMADSGFVYVPKDCAAGARCRVHVAFHGCRQGIGFIGRSFARQAGYNRWADANRIVVLYPQAEKSLFWPLNPRGCWDWWGYSGADYAARSGAQISAVHRMLIALGAS